MAIFGGGGLASGVLGMGFVIGIGDQVSRNANTIMGKFKQLEGVTDRAANRMAGAFNKIEAGAALLVVAGIGIAAMSFPIRSAIAFESAFTGVRKTVTASEAEFKQLETNFRNISKTAPITVVELSRIGELAGQLGVEGVDNITNFTNTVAKISVTTNLTSEAAATDFARISNIMQEPIANVERMASSIVDLGNNFATTEAEITTFSKRIAGAGKIAGLTTADILGISTAFSSVGVQAERGGTAVSKTLFKMTEAVNVGGRSLEQFAAIAGLSATQFAQLFEKDAAAAFNQFVAGIGTSGIEAVGLLEELELADQRLKQAFVSVAGAGGIMEKAITRSSKAWDENTALTREAELRYNTVSSQLQIMKNNFNDLGISIGNVFLPVIKVLSFIMKGIAQTFNLIAKTTLGKVILGLTGALIGLAAIMGIVLVVTGGLTLATAKLAVAFSAAGEKAIGLAFANKGLLGGFKALAISMGITLPPLIAFIAAGAVIIGTIKLMNKSVRMFDDVVSGASQPLTGFMGIMQKLGGIIRGTLEIWKSATAETFSLSSDTHAALERLGIAEFVVNLGTTIARVKLFFKGFVQGFQTVFGITSKIVKSIIESINKLGEVFGLPAIGKNTTDIQEWINAGKTLAFVIAGLMVPSLLIMAATILIIASPIIVLVILIREIVKEIKRLSQVVPEFISSLPGGNKLLGLIGIDTGTDETAGRVANVIPDVNLDQPTPLGVATAQVSTVNTSSETINNNQTNTVEILKSVNLEIGGKVIPAIVNEDDNLQDSRFD